jgi:hypothetical protein
LRRLAVKAAAAFDIGLFRPARLNVGNEHKTRYNRK